MSSTISSLQKRIAIVAPSLAGVLRDRANLIRALKDRGHAVLVIAASHLSGEVAALHHLGAEHRNFEPKPPGMSIFANRRVQQAIRDVIAAWQADTSIVSGAALASLAARAARKAGVKQIVTIVSAEMGVGSDEERRLMVIAFRGAVKLSQAVVCHNAEDARVLTSMLKPKGQRVIVTPGDGVDLKEFTVAPMPSADVPLTFLMIANPDARGAIEAYTDAARALTGKGLTVRCILATDREAAQDTTLLTVESIAFQGRAADPAAVLGTVHVVVHLSADDGSPAALKQALAAGRPVVTLNVPGCREAVDERVNGCLVPPGDPSALLAAMESFISHPGLLPAESRAARIKAERSFGASAVLAPVLAAIDG
jgi:glycosyltransferase involved in cell wall biosynthesis